LPICSGGRAVANGDLYDTDNITIVHHWEPGAEGATCCSIGTRRYVKKRPVVHRRIHLPLDGRPPRVRRPHRHSKPKSMSFQPKITAGLHHIRRLFRGLRQAAGMTARQARIADSCTFTSWTCWNSHQLRCGAQVFRRRGLSQRRQNNEATSSDHRMPQRGHPCWWVPPRSISSEHLSTSSTKRKIHHKVLNARLSRAGSLYRGPGRRPRA